MQKPYQVVSKESVLADGTCQVKQNGKKLESFVVSELAPVEGNVWTDEDGNKYSDKDCKNVWSALTGKLDTDGWGESGMIDENRPC